MAKTYRNLYPQVWAFPNLYAAWRKARKGKRGQSSVADFEYNLESNLLALQAELRDQTYRPGGYHSFHIHEPKRRRIQDTTFDLQEALLEAGLQTEEERGACLHRADLALAKLRFYIRLSVDMDWLNMGQYEHVGRMMDEVGRLLGSWQRKERDQQRTP